MQQSTILKGFSDSLVSTNERLRLVVTTNSNVLLVEGHYIKQRKLEILPSSQRISYPTLEREGAMSPGGKLLYAKCTKAMASFLSEKDGFLLEVVTRGNEGK